MARATAVTRMPADLYTAVSDAATEQGVSINQFIVACLAAAVGYRLPPKDES